MLKAAVDDATGDEQASKQTYERRFHLRASFIQMISL